MSAVVVLFLRVLLVVALYAFLCSALWVMWKGLGQTRERISGRQIPIIRLQVRAGDQTPVAWAFAQPEVTLGRDPRSDLALDDDAVSVRHAVLRFNQGQWWLQDLGSKNGTRLNAEQLVGATVLANGDEIRCGQARLTVGLDEGRQSQIRPAEGGQDA